MGIQFSDAVTLPSTLDNTSMTEHQKSHSVNKRDLNTKILYT